MSASSDSPALSPSPASIASRKFGPITLAPGVTVGQIGVFVFVVVSALCIVVFVPLMQAFVFNEMLHVPKAVQGRLAGNLLTAQQIAVLLFVGPAGSLCDRIGRKQVLVIAITGYALCMLAYPLAPGVGTLYVIQFVFGMMTSGHIAGSSSMISDYPLNLSRGKFVAAMLLLQAAISALLVGYIGARAPSWLVADGFDAATAGRYVFWCLAVIALTSALVAAFFLKNPPRAGVVPLRLPFDPRRDLKAFFVNLKQVVAHGRRNPRFGLVMMMGFVIRSDYYVMLSFVALWVVNAANSQGIPTAEALKTAGLLTLVFKLSTAAAQAVFGFVVDRFDRSRVLVGSLFFTGLALVSTLLIHDVFGMGIFFIVAWIGVAESALIVCGQALLGAEAPTDLRGSAVGIFYFTGTLGVILMSIVAGSLFDKVGYAAPFIMVGLLNLLFAVIGSFLVFRKRAPIVDVTGATHAR